MCELCGELSGEDSRFERIYGRPSSHRQVHASQHFVALPTLGQIVEGYLLIVSRRHMASVGHGTAHELRDLDRFVSDVINALSHEFRRPVCVFEHGAVNEVGGCGIYHAHLHALPLDKSPLGSLREAISSAPSLCTSWEPLQDCARRGQDYLYFADATGRWVFNDPPNESQFMRRVVAKELGVHEWDWRTSGLEQALLSTLSRLAGRFANPIVSPA